METNIRIVGKGNALYFVARKVQLSVKDLQMDHLQTLCTLLKKHNIAAVPYSKQGNNCLLIQASDGFKDINLSLAHEQGKGSTFSVRLTCTNEKLTLYISEEDERKYIEDWYMRRLQINVLQKTGFYIINKSPNVYYDCTPIFSEEDEDCDIVAYRRYYLFTEYFEGKGLGVGIDVGTAYFSRHSVEYYFREGKEKRFEELKSRQSTEYKGTLLYKGPNGRSRCYWDKWGDGLTLSQTRSFAMNGRQFTNSYDYFQKVYPDFKVFANDLVAFVSFKGIGTVPVPARLLFLTVGTDNLTDDINQQDKYTAQQKRNLINQFWHQMGKEPFGYNIGLQPRYYSPDEAAGGTFTIPALQFAREKILQGPKRRLPMDYKKYYIQKYHTLKDTGCYYTPPTMERELHFVFPSFINERGRQRILNDLLKETISLTGKELTPIDHIYNKEEHLEMIYDLKNNYETGTVVFIFDNNDPSNYFTISQELKGWKIIRMTMQELNRKLNRLYNHPKGRANWDAYIALNAFKIVTELGCIPYMFTEPLSYQAQLVIDVSENYSHFALGLLIYKQGMRRPLFDYIIKENPDGRNDAINPHLLFKYLKELLLKNIQTFTQYNVTKMLVLRDGKESNEEYTAFAKVMNDLSEKLPIGFDFTFIEYHKKSMKSIRLFLCLNGDYKNPLEGSWLLVNRTTALLFPTGEGTLTQGTASPILIKSKYKEVVLKDVLRDIFLTSQLNFGSPRVAQKLTYLAKRVDDLLKERRSQMVIKIK